MKDKPALLALIRNKSIESPMGGAVEDYIDQFGADNDLCDAVRRFLDSGSEMNREATIGALMHNKSTARDLEADALLLHFQGELGTSNVEFPAVRYLYTMAEFGSETAKRVLRILLLDDRWAKAYGQRNSKDLLS